VNPHGITGLAFGLADIVAEACIVKECQGNRERHSYFCPLHKVAADLEQMNA
jgi:hypothetical protein